MQRKVLVFGTFDGLHPGHVAFIEEAQRQGKLHVVVARDRNVLKIKGGQPEFPEDVRAETLREKFPGAEVILGDPENFLQPVLAVSPDLIMLGYDQKMPPGVTMEDLPCPVKRAKPFDPHIHKSSLRRKTSGSNNQLPRNGRKI